MGFFVKILKYFNLQILQQIDDANGFPFFVGIEIDMTRRHKKINFVPAAKFNLPIPTDEDVDRVLALDNIKIEK